MEVITLLVGMFVVSPIIIGIAIVLMVGTFFKLMHDHYNKR